MSEKRIPPYLPLDDSFVPIYTTFTQHKYVSSMKTNYSKTNKLINGFCLWWTRLNYGLPNEVCHKGGDKEKLLSPCGANTNTRISPNKLKSAISHQRCLFHLFLTPVTCSPPQN